MADIILIKDIYKLKERKEKELAFYKEKLIEIQEKLYWIENELEVTKYIIKIIEEENLKEKNDKKIKK